MPTFDTLMQILFTIFMLRVAIGVYATWVDGSRDVVETTLFGALLTLCFASVYAIWGG